MNVKNNEILDDDDSISTLFSHDGNDEKEMSANNNNNNSSYLMGNDDDDEEDDDSTCTVWPDDHDCNKYIIIDNDDESEVTCASTLSMDEDDNIGAFGERDSLCSSSLGDAAFDAELDFIDIGENDSLNNIKFGNYYHSNHQQRFDATGAEENFNSRRSSATYDDAGAFGEKDSVQFKQIKASDNDGIDCQQRATVSLLPGNVSDDDDDDVDVDDASTSTHHDDGDYDDEAINRQDNLGVIIEQWNVALNFNRNNNADIEEKGAVKVDDDDNDDDDDDDDVDDGASDDTHYGRDGEDEEDEYSTLSGWSSTNAYHHHRHDDNILMGEGNRRQTLRQHSKPPLLDLNINIGSDVEDDANDYDKDDDASTDTHCSGGDDDSDGYSSLTELEYDSSYIKSDSVTSSVLLPPLPTRCPSQDARAA